MTLFEIIQKIAPNIKEYVNIHAMWLEGSWATGMNSEHSDIDVWLDVNDGTFDECIAVFRNELAKVGKIDWEKSRGIYSDAPRLTKQTFHLDGFSDEQVIELDLQEHGRQFKFDKKENKIKVIFDKDKTIQWK